MQLTPEYVATRKDGRLLIARDPYVRHHETRFIGWTLILAIPALLGLMWLLSDRPDKDGLAWVAAPAAVVGAALLIRARVAGYVIDDRSAAVIADPVADAVLQNGRWLCAASDVAAVAMRRVRDQRWALHELLLVPARASSEPNAESPSILMGLAAHIEGPGRQLAALLRVPFEKR